MIEDIHEPVECYRSVFKDSHARNTSEYFEGLVRRSSVDEVANVKTVKKLRILEQQVADVSSSIMWWKVLRWTVIFVGVICLVLIWTQSQLAWLIGAVGAAALVFAKLNPLIKDVDGRLRAVKTERDNKLEAAWQQMAPLNKLYDWHIVARLARSTVPRLELDPYFAKARLDELRDVFGWDDSPDQNRSVVFAHSGVLNGNPFVVARTLDHWMGTKAYHGSLEISWTEQERDSHGRWRTVTKRQTLHASVTKPFPEYASPTIVIYGNEAAPDLSFSRTPSKLSELEDGMINNWTKRRAIKKLEAKSRDLDKGKGFTVMSNREFDALFAAIDRDHEVQFRLLFTPLAQQEMVKLLKDKKVGYGDDFQFAKQRMINVVRPAHLAETDICADPAKFQAFELAHARKFFNEYHNDFFRSLFFGLAPILSIPLYQQHRSHADIYKDVYGRAACFWEHESIANYFGENRFQHPKCVTRTILKTESAPASDGTQSIRVAAHGYRCTDRIDYVSVYGGDGRFHDVPVSWVEYIGVRRDSEMITREIDFRQNEEQRTKDFTASNAHFQTLGAKPSNVILRRAIVAALLPN